MAVQNKETQSRFPMEYYWESTDTKPEENIPIGADGYETDTGNIYKWFGTTIKWKLI